DQKVEDFSPRLGIVYQPADWLSLYASYSRSFEINSGTDAAGNPFDPTFGTQYEIGAKTEFFNGALGATLALFKIKRDNVLTPDPTDTRFSIQTGEQESQGIELDISGRITPNWSIIASYSYLDAKITRDNRFPEGNRLPWAAPHSFSLWTKYDFDGSLQGLSLGGGIFFVGERWESLNNVYELPSYTRVDLFAAYRFNPNLTAQINLKNAFDRRYYEGTFGAVHPGAPRGITASVVYQF
ncbi:MAG: TonB-dependent receptor, partial [Desertifilum sp. SIO1I2]|nr:TonB-dependent receptor [Desertifilum sp. SIO1I2]